MSTALSGQISARDLVTPHIEALRKFAAILESFDPHDSAEFHAIVGLALNKYSLPAGALADHFNVSRGTISRNGLPKVTQKAGQHRLRPDKQSAPPLKR